MLGAAKEKCDMRLHLFALVATIGISTGAAQAACGAGIAPGDFTNIAWTVDPFPMSLPTTFVELDRTDARSGPHYSGKRYVFGRNGTVESLPDADALFASAEHVLIDFGFFGFDPRKRMAGPDSRFYAIIGKRCDIVQEIDFFAGDDPRLIALYAQLDKLAGQYSWALVPGAVPPKLLPTFHFPALPNG